jgi:hypothetical protein
MPQEGYCYIFEGEVPWEKLPKDGIKWHERRKYTYSSGELKNKAVKYYLSTDTKGLNKNVHILRNPEDLSFTPITVVIYKNRSVTKQSRENEDFDDEEEHTAKSQESQPGPDEPELGGKRKTKKVVPSTGVIDAEISKFDNQRLFEEIGELIASKASLPNVQTSCIHKPTEGDFYVFSVPDGDMKIMNKYAKIISEDGMLWTSIGGDECLRLQEKNYPEMGVNIYDKLKKVEIKKYGIYIKTEANPKGARSREFQKRIYMFP